MIIGRSVKRKMHPNSLANLNPPYKKGENGHSGYPLKERLYHALDHPLKVPKPDAPAGEHIVYATLKGAISCEPSSAHLKEVWDRVEGKLQDVRAGNNGDNRVINFILSEGQSKSLIEGIAKRLSEQED